jgi:hypothetical protein
MRYSLACGLVSLVPLFLFTGAAPVAVAAEASLSVKDGYGVTLNPGGDDASTFVLKGQGIREVTLEVVALSGERATTCATITHSWAKDKAGEEGQILLVYKRQADDQIVPFLGFGVRRGAGSFGGRVVKVKEKRLGSFRPAAGRGLTPKGKHLIEIAVFADKDGEKHFRDSVKDAESFTAAMKTLRSFGDVKAWAKKNPKVTVVMLSLSWLPAE